MIFAVEQKGEKMDDPISRQAAIDALIAEGRNVDSHYLESERIIHESDAIEAIAMLPSAQPEPQWHPFTSAYGPDPTESGPYLLTREGEDSKIRWVEMRYYNGVYFETGDFINKMIAWAEVPEPYRGDQ